LTHVAGGGSEELASCRAPGPESVVEFEALASLLASSPSVVELPLLEPAPEEPEGIDVDEPASPDSDPPEELSSPCPVGPDSDGLDALLHACGATMSARPTARAVHPRTFE
jgi:hypothetical protein